MGPVSLEIQINNIDFFIMNSWTSGINSFACTVGWGY